MTNSAAGLPAELADRAAAELAPDERLIWAGQPRPDLVLRSAYFLVPFGIVFTVIASIWTIVGLALTFGIMAPCGLPFLAVGIGLILSPIWLRAMARKTLYALTDRRAIVWEPGWFGAITVRNYTAAGLGHMARIERSDGSGDLVFEEITTFSSTSDGARSHTTQRGFLSIDKVREVEDMVRQTLLSSG